MKITLLTTNKPGILYKSSIIFKRHKYRVEQELKKQVNSSQFLYTFILSNDGNYDGLIESLLAIQDVVEVESLEQDLENNQTEIDKTRLIEIAQNLISLYPDFVGVIQDLDRNPEISNRSMLKLGQYVGEGLITQGKLKQVSPKNISLAIKKIILPAIEPFAIADDRKNQVELYANPFCSNQEISDEPKCYFLTGMIQGLLHSVKNLSEITVEETSCKASGGSSCIFTIH